MLKIKFCLFIFTFSFLSIFSQEENINNYKYIIVPEQFEFQKNENSFQINSMTKFLFKKYGFNALLSTEIYPEDLSKNRCLALTTRMNDNSGLIGKKINFDLVNCSNVIVYSSKNATSKLKVYERAYQEAIRNTFESLKTVNYNYVAIEDIFQSPSEPEKIEVEKTLVVEVEAPQVVKVMPEVKTVVIPEVKKVVKSLPIEESKKVESFLIAKNNSNGFNLVDNANKLHYKLLETSVNNVYIVKGIEGVLFKSKGKWILEYYADNQLIKKELNIKF